MQGGLTLRRPPRQGFPLTTLEQRALRLATGAPVTGAVARGSMVAAGFGDGSVRLFRPESEPVVIRAHRGAVLSIAADALPDAVLTGGDDARFLRIAGDGGISELASFGTRWVDCVAAGPGWRACSSGRTVQLWRLGGERQLVFEHPSTVGGLAFDPKGRKLAVAHYGGASVWERGEKRWKPSRLVWKGSHGAVTGMLGIEGVFAGFADGAVLAGRFAAEVEDLVVKGSGGAAITALAVPPEGWLFIGDAAGDVLWARLGELDLP